MDYKSFNNYNNGINPNDKRAKDYQRQWWKCDGKELAENVTVNILTLVKQAASRLYQTYISSRYYANMPMSGLRAEAGQRIANTPVSKDRLAWNVCASCVDTLASKIAKNRPQPFFVTNKGSWEQQEKSKKLNSFMKGVFYQNRVYELAADVFKDAAIGGTGIVHIFSENKKIKYERVMPVELFVDEVEAEHQIITQLHRLKMVDRDTLREAFPEFEKEISEAEGPNLFELGYRENISDVLQVAESWHLRSSEDATDGKHVIIINNCTLFEEEYERDYFPFAFLKYNRRQTGFFGQGLVEQIEPIQENINKLLWLVDRSIQVGGTFKIAVENSSKAVYDKFSNDIGAFIPFTNTPPQYLCPPLVQPEIYQQLMNNVQKAYEISGISQLSATSQKPQGLNSGTALRTYNDIETERFQLLGKAWEQFFLDITDISIDIIQDIKGFSVTVPITKDERLSTFSSVQEISWKDIDLKKDEYVIQAFPISSLPSDPAGRRQTIQEYIQAGLIDPKEGRSLLNFPDLEGSDSLQEASRDYIKYIIEKMLNEGEYTPPDPFDDLQMSQQLAISYYQRAKTMDVEEEKLELLRRYMTQIQEIIKEATPPPAPAMDPLANPESTPTSDLVPNVAQPAG